MGKLFGSAFFVFSLSLAACSPVDTNLLSTSNSSQNEPSQTITPVPLEDIVVLKGTPEEMGRQYGEALGPQMRELVDGWLRPHLARVPFYRLYARNRVRELIPNQPQHLQDEVEAIVDTVRNVRLYDAYRANFTSDILQMFGRPFGCSTFVVMPERSETGGMLYGRNLDYFQSDILREYWTPIVFARDGAYKILAISVPGHTGVMTGINENGVMMSIQVSFSDERYSTSGVSSLFAFRLVLEQAENALHARDLYAALDRTVPVNVTIADGRDAVVLEAGVWDHVSRLPNSNGVLYAANHFESEELQSSNHGRDDRWDVLSRHDGDRTLLTIEDVKSVVADAARDNPSFIAQNILAGIVDFQKETLSWGSEAPVAIEGDLKVINYRELFDAL